MKGRDGGGDWEEKSGNYGKGFPGKDESVSGRSSSMSQQYHVGSYKPIEMQNRIPSPNMKIPISSSNLTVNREHTLFLRLSSALFYATASCFITIINKTVLTNYGFPSSHIIALGQLSITFVVLLTLRYFKQLTFPNLSRQTVRKLFPLPIFYLANLFGGLLSTKALSLTMFTVLRRISILMTMIGEMWLLGKKQSAAIQFSVFIMIFGSFIAALHDLVFNLTGYIYITINNFATATNAIFTKKKLEHKDLGKYGILFYNALFSLPFAIAICLYTDAFTQAHAFTYWDDPMFLLYFSLSCSMGLILNLSIVLCTYYNSALVCTVIGCLKNIFVSYYGILFPTADYIFNMNNFVGVSISVVGSLMFAYYTFVTKK